MILRRPMIAPMTPPDRDWTYQGLGVSDPVNPPPIPPPTPALPGSAEKVAELARRMERGEALWHPLDGLIPVPKPRPQSLQSPRGEVAAKG